MFVLLSRKPMKQPFDNEACYYDIFHQDKNYKAEAKALREKFPDTRTVLEIGCGTGNLTKELEDLGFEITCIEPSGEMLKYFKGEKSKVIQITIQDYEPPEEEFDLVLATYDVLNYIPDSECFEVRAKIHNIGGQFYGETWDRRTPVRLLTHKIADSCHRLRFGFKIIKTVYLWYIFWGRGLIISHHRLYL